MNPEENMDMNNAPAGAPEGGSRSVWGWVVLAVIVILIIIGIVALGGDDVDTDGEDVNIEEMDDSDEIEDIEADLDNTDFEGDVDLDNIEAELDGGTQ